MRNLRSSNRRFLTASLCAAVLSLAVSCAQTPPPETGSIVGKSAPDFNLTGADGKPVKLSDLRGKVVVVDFWATWCPPCRQEIPDFVALQSKYADKGLVVVGLTVDDSWDPVRPFMSQNRMNYPVARVDDASIVKAYDVTQGIPTTFVIDRSGVIRLRHLGYAPAATFEKAVQDVL